MVRPLRMPYRLLPLLFVLLLWSPHPRSTAQPAASRRQVDDELIVRFRRGVDERAKNAAHSRAVGTRAKAFGIVEGLELVKLPPGMTVEEGRGRYRANRDVLYAEPNYVVTTATTPNDPYFGDHWDLHNFGQSSGTPDADIDAPEAWDLTTGSRDVVVAVIDTGIDYNHPDLAANMFRNEADCNSNGVDDDGNGYVDDCHGIDTANSDSNPMDDHYHGTHVAGIIGAVGNNSVGVTGINWSVSLMACKFLGAAGSGTVAGAIACMDYVKTMKERGVNVVATNNSWGGGPFSQALADAIDAHRQLGILFVAAAGNGGSDLIGDDNDAAPFYPASTYAPNIISVASTTRTDDLSYFSNFGRRTVHVGAPGSTILSTAPSNAYFYLSGTSMAAPHVTGVAALLKAYDPTRDWRAIKNLILAGGDTLTSLADSITQKRLNANGALTCDNSTILSRLRPIASSLVLQTVKPVDLAALHIRCASPNGDVAVTVTPGGETVTLLDGGTGTDQAAGDGIYSAQWNPSTTGVFTLTFPNGDAITVNVAEPALSIAPTSLDFGGTNVGGSSDKTITVKNEGGGTLTGTATTSGAFSIVSGGSYSLQGGASQTVTVRFSPTATASYLGNVAFTGGGGASASLSGSGVIAPTISMVYGGKLRDRVGPGDATTSADGSLDGAFTVTMQSSTGTRTVTSLELRRDSFYKWDTIPGNAVWVLGAAASLDASLYNLSTGAVSFSVADGGSFVVFASDQNNSLFSAGNVFTLTAKCDDGSTATAQVTIPPPASGPGLALTWQGKMRDRVGPGDTSLAADGSLDGTFTVALQAGSGTRTVTSLELTRGSPYAWDTTYANSYWILGAAPSLDAALYNSATGTVSFSVADGGSFVVFASDQNNNAFGAGSVFTLTAKFSDGSTSTVQLTLPPPPPAPALTLTFNGKMKDRVGPGDTSASADGALDGTFTATLDAASGTRTVTALSLTRGSPYTWDTTSPNAYWILGAAATQDAALYNGSSGAVNFSASGGGSFVLFASDQNNSLFATGTVFTLTVWFADGSTSTAQVTLPSPPPGPALTLTYSGKLKDRVGPGDTSLAADGSLDGTFSAALAAGSGARTVTSLLLTRGSYNWDTTSPNSSWILGAAPTVDASLYNASNGSVNFSVADGGSFVLFASDQNNSLFATGNAFTLTAKFGDGSTSTAQLTLPPPPPAPGLTITWSGKMKDRVGQGDTSLTADGQLDGTFAVALAAGSGNRTVTSLQLARGSGSWDTTSPNSSWVLGAATSLDASLLNASNASVNFAVSDGGSFVLFAADWNNSMFATGSVFTVTAKFGDGSTGTAQLTLPPPPPPPGLTLAFSGKIRDRVGQGDASSNPDGALDGTFTVTLAAGSGARTVTSLQLARGSGSWDTTSPNSSWILGAAASLDAALLNGSNAAVNFAVADGGSFVVFAADWNNSMFSPGSVFTLTVKLGDGSTGTVSVTIPTS